MILFALVQRLLALASFAILAVAAWLIWSWYDAEHVAATLNLSEPSDARLWWGAGLMAFSLLGRLPILTLLGRGGATPPARRGESTAIAAPDGAMLNVEIDGAVDGPILVFTHGWGLSARIWAEARVDLGQRFGLVFWDLPGLGRSSRPPAGYSLQSFAEDLHAVVDGLPEHRPVILVGHSIGGMTVQTFCARHPELLNSRIAGVVLENTTHTNPLKTMVLPGVLTKLQPVIEAFLRIDTVLSPLLWLMNWQAWLSGFSHVAARLVGFGTQPSRGQLERTTLLITKASPAVQARGNLAMLHWSVTDRLPTIDVPALVFAGGRDLITKDHAGETIAHHLPQGRLVRVEDAGHMGPIERSTFYNERIADFAGSLETSSDAAATSASRAFMSPDLTGAPMRPLCDGSDPVGSSGPGRPLLPFS